MRILFFLESLHGGGRERRAAELILYLRELYGSDAIEVVVTEEEIHYEEISGSGIRIHVLKRKTKYDPRIFSKFYGICRDFKPDLIHSWGKMSTFYSIPAKIISGVPLVASLIADTLNTSGKNSRYGYLFRLNTFFSDRVLSNSQAGLDTYGVDPGKSRVIYNGVRLSRFITSFDTEVTRKEFGIDTPYVVIMVATFSRYKDYDLFVNTAKTTMKRRNDVTFLAVGDGPDFNRIKARVENEKVTNVVLAGRRKNVERFIAASDIGLLCTFSEGISNSIIEYMASGIPVIASDIIGGSRELVLEGVTGYCTGRSPEIISGHINRLLDDPKLRKSMGMKGKERIEKNFSIARMGEEFISLYNEVLSNKNRRSALASKISL